MAGFSDELKRQLPQVILGILAGRQGGLPAAGAFQQGMLQRQQQDEARQRQGMLDEERRQAQEAAQAHAANVEERARGAEARAADDQKMQKLNAALAYLSKFEQGQAETATDPAAAENAMLGRAGALEGMFGVPQGQLSGAIPSMAPAISNRKKRQAKELFDQAKETYDPNDQNDQTKPYDQAWKTSIRIKSELFPERPEGVTPAELEQMFLPPATEIGTGAQAAPVVRRSGRPDVPNTPEEQFYQQYAVEHGKKTFAELSSSEQATAKAKWAAAGRDTDDPVLGEIRRLRLEQMQGGSGSQYTQTQISTFNQIVGAYERSPLVRAADRTLVLDDSIKAIRVDPKNAANQMSLAYSYIQALDTYQSAVREGELQNLGTIGTRWQQLAAEANRVVSTGAFLPPEVAKQIADNAQQLVATITAGRKRKQQEFASRARVSNVGPMWDAFIAGFPEPTSATPAGEQPPVRVTPPSRAGGPGPAPGSNPFRR